MKIERVQTSPVNAPYDPYGQIAAFLEGERLGATVRVSDLPTEIQGVSCEELSLQLAERGHNVEVTTDDPSRSPSSYLLKLLQGKPGDRERELYAQITERSDDAEED